MLLTRIKGGEDGDGRERWVGRSSFISVHVSYLWHQCPDTIAGETRASLNVYMSPPSAIHDGTVFSDLESETCRVGLAASPPCVQEQKTMFSNAACSNSLSQVRVSSKNWSLSSLKERKRDLSLSACQTVLEITAIFCWLLFLIQPVLFWGFFFFFNVTHSLDSNRLCSPHVFKIPVQLKIKQ